MRSGSLDRTITLQSVTTTVDEYGTPAQGWSDFATARAQLIQASTSEYLRAYGETDTAVVIFRIRWLDGVTADMRVSYGGQFYNIREIKEIGRRRRLELRAELVRAEVG
jgi:SPP1 family predicted phage head-tail adaptor